MAFLLDEMKLRERVYMLRNLFLNALPDVPDDQLLIAISATPRGRAEATQHFRRVVEPALAGGVPIGAMRRTAASHVAAVLDLLRQGRIAGAGIPSQEDIPLALLRENRFLAWFFDGAAQAHHSSMEAIS